MAPPREYFVTIEHEQEGIEGTETTVESWPVIAFDEGGIPLLLGERQLEPVSQRMASFPNARWELTGGEPTVSTG